MYVCVSVCLCVLEETVIGTVCTIYSVLIRLSWSVSTCMPEIVVVTLCYAHVQLCVKECDLCTTCICSLKVCVVPK